MKTIHLINASAWAGNALCWFFYAHSTFMSVASCIGVIAALVLAKKTDPYDAYMARRRAR